MTRHADEDRDSDAGGIRRSEALWLAVCGVWLWSAAWKLLGWPAFVETVLSHDVLPASWIAWLAVVPAWELCLGILGILLGAARQRILGLPVPVLSALTLIGLSFYLCMVPEETIRRVGCGCHGTPLYGSIKQFGFSSRPAALALNLALTAVCIVRAAQCVRHTADHRA